MTDKTFLDVHVLHAVPWSNLNRDELGTPKQMEYGGATRARISSQCTKRAARFWLEENTDLGRALRTRRLPQLVRESLTERHGFSPAEAVRCAVAVFEMAGIKVAVPDEDDDSKELQGNQLTFTTPDAAARIADAVAAHNDELVTEEFPPSKQTKAALIAPLEAHNPIIALCGRMLADLPGAKVDGALQMAHAFTTHPATVELDYFTAVDDYVQNKPGESGAGHIKENEYTNGVFYRHATIGLRQLADLLSNSGSATAQVAGHFVQAFVLAEPTGKQNSANAHTRPDLVAVTLRSGRPVSFASAFEKPISHGRNGGYMAASIEALHERSALENQIYGTDDLIGSWYFAGAVTAEAHGLGDQVSGMSDLVQVVEQAVAAHR